MDKEKQLAVAHEPRTTHRTQSRAKGRRLSASIYEEVRDRICQLVYPPQHLIREAELADEFGISRTPVRQALQRLEIEGYVETRNGVGTIVTAIDIPAFRDIYAMRLQLTTLIGQMNPKPGKPRMVEKASELLARARELAAGKDLHEFWLINLERHAIILSLIGNSALRELYDSYYFRTSRVWYLVIDQIWEDQTLALSEELEDLCKALELGNAQVVCNVEYNHLSYYLKMFERFAASGET
ncbi:GntR family transcriptional regulator [Pseudohoeflea coraliihabitans]|uniref:GntR family transcriptional regulator n=1 Tax=Pseudohoeflea coraliihabitans TaxID=2860393 RepID=A0ABS6WKT3_9HYPH|nr:GntR family transcriptional regulator [Pseudohoeflea sp. DP4N28-3]MBW3096258.1 GntR family transcriptional regulator [Pseudohoeflea sp. DP4N28-3]